MAAQLPSIKADISWNLMFSPGPFRGSGMAMSLGVEEKHEMVSIHQCQRVLDRVVGATRTMPEDTGGTTKVSLD
jgi:hypothetical protein